MSSKRVQSARSTRRSTPFSVDRIGARSIDFGPAMMTAAIALVACAASPAMAQTSPDVPAAPAAENAVPPAQESAAEGSDIIVTAQRREEKAVQGPRVRGRIRGGNATEPEHHERTGYRHACSWLAGQERAELQPVELQHARPDARSVLRNQPRCSDLSQRSALQPGQHGNRILRPWLGPGAQGAAGHAFRPQCDWRRGALFDSDAGR